MSTTHGWPKNEEAAVEAVFHLEPIGSWSARQPSAGQIADALTAELNAQIRRGYLREMRATETRIMRRLGDIDDEMDWLGEWKGQGR